MHYQHGAYSHFFVFEPKQRYISKASVRDRFVHHMVYASLTPILDPKFIHHSLACRAGKGIHMGVNSLKKMLGKVSKQGTESCVALKMDIKRFFDTIDHNTLKQLIRKKVADVRLLGLIDQIIDSFAMNQTEHGNVGLPLGNVTSQLFANIYLHELDLFVKHILKQKYYLRYCDDFIILSPSKNLLKDLLSKIQIFLNKKLFLELHPKKILLRKAVQGIDFLGYIVFLDHCILRTKSRKRLKHRLKRGFDQYFQEKLSAVQFDQRLQSYLGMLSHANQYQLSQALKNAFWIRKEKF